MKNFRILILGLLLAAQSSLADKKHLTLGMTGEFENLNPIVSQTALTKYMLYLAWRPLTYLNDKDRWAPLMIKDIPTLENKQAKLLPNKGMEYSIELLKDASWGDGVPVTCKDVELAWRIGTNTNVSLGERERYDNIKSVSWQESQPKKCSIVLKTAKFDYFTMMPEPVPAHLEGPIFEKFKDKNQGYDQNSLYTKAPSTPGLYNGPYLITEVRLGSHVSFAPNPNWKGKKPFFSKAVFKIVPNSSVLPARFQSGDLDMGIPPGGFGLDQAVAFEKVIEQKKLPLKVVYQDGHLYAHLDMNMRNPIFQDLRVRQAIAHAINRQEIVDTILEGRSKVAHHILAPTDPWATDNVTKYKYDRKKAEKLLDDAGWRPGPDGIRLKDGKRLSFNIVGASGIKLIDLVEAYVKAQFKAVGIDLVIKNEPQRVFFGDTLKKGRFDMAFFSWSSQPENSPRSLLHSSMIPSEANAWAGQNYNGYSNPEMDKLIDSLESEFNAKKRAATAHKILQLYTKDLTVLPIYYRPYLNVIPSDLKGYKLVGHQFYETLSVENWYR